MTEEKLPPDFVKVLNTKIKPNIDLTALSSLPKPKPVSHISTALDFKNFGLNSCPVCGDGTTRGMIVVSIVMNLKVQGSFSVGSVKSFWKRFSNNVCNHCLSTLDSIDEKKGQALKLLEEAVRLDNSNSSAKENLSALKRLS